MNYNKVIKDLKERNDKLQEQYRLRDIRCIHLEYENEMLKSDFEAQHELTKKYAEENQLLENQQKEFIEYMNKTIEELECEDVDDEETKGYLIQRIDTFKEIFSKYKEIIGENNER